MKRLFFIVMLLGMFFHANAYHWDVNINAYPNTMSIIGVIAIDGNEQAVNTIEIGAFSGDECRGRGLLTDQYYSMFNHYYVFLTVYGNDGDALSFRLYDHALGEELDGYCTNTVTFTTNGTLGDPGAPYMFNYASSGDNYHWNVDVHQYATTMTFCGIVKIDGEEQLTDQLEIGAFCGDECRGRELTISDYYPMFNHYYVFLTVYGNDGDPLSFRLYDHSLGQELDLICTNSVNFSTNATMGDPGTPYVFEFFSQTSNYSITATANPTNGGTVSGGGYFQQGQTCTLTATANEGYTFTNWTENGTQVSTNATYSFTVTGNRALVANFEEVSSGDYHWDVDVHQYANNMTFCGIIEIDNEEQLTDQLEIGAFCGDECRGRELTISEYYPAFNHYYVFLTVYGNDGDPLNFRLYDHNLGQELDLNCTNSINFSTNATMGDPGVPYVFEFFSQTTNYTVTATANPTNGGTVSGGGSFQQGQTCTLTATANTGYTFINWTENDTEVSTNATYSFTVTSNRNLVANFQENSSGEYHWDVNIHAYPTTMTVLGIVRIDGVEQFSNFLEIGAFCGDECRGREKTSDIYYNMINHYVVFLTLYGNAGDQLTFRLYDHSLGQELDLNCVTTMTFVVNASYGTPIEPFVYDFVSTVYYDITASANPVEGGTVEGAGSYEENSTCTLTATANTGYHFVNWTKNGTVVSTSASYSFTVMGVAAYVANFELNSYNITASVNPTAGGTVSGAGTYNHFESCTLTATANTGYHFVNWTKNGQEVSTNASYTFTVTEAASYVANFELNSYNITASANPTAGGTVSGAGTYNHFATCTLTATNNTGYHFLNWTKNGQVVSTNTIYSFTVTEAASYVANFELNTYEITVEVHPVNGGTATGGGTFVHGTSCTLTAVPDEQFLFSNWSKNGEAVSTDLIYTFTVTEEATYVANFERITVTQTTYIYTGWNWYSTYIEQEGINGLEMLQESLGTIGQRITAQNGTYQAYYANIGWMGLLNSLTNEDSYQIQATDDGEISMTGPVVHPSDHPITLYPGWNWIGYPCISDMDITTAFSNLTPTYGDQVKIANDYASYYPGLLPNTDWFGSLTTFTPGIGLLYHSNNTDPVTFTYPEIDRYTPSVKNVTFDNNHWTADRHAYPNNMTVSAVVELGNEELLSENYELAVFANGECRGSVKLTYFEPLNRYMALLVVSGDETTALQFALYNTETGMEYFDCETFADYNTNAILGTPMEPFTVRFRNNTGVDELGYRVQVYPNPVGRGETFSLGMATDEEISVEIINTMGTVLRVENATKQPVNITAPSVAGIYTLRIVANGKNVIYKKLIVK